MDVVQKEPTAEAVNEEQERTLAENKEVALLRGTNSTLAAMLYELLVLQDMAPHVKEIPLEHLLCYADGSIRTLRKMNAASLVPAKTS